MTDRPRRSLVAALLLVAANVLLPLSVAVFAKGFFPYKPLLPGLAQYADVGYGAPAAAPFDRVIFMVVDALRSDFVYTANSGFEYMQSLIRNGEAVPFTAHAGAPTVTMPRIKALTTGSTPSFLDVVLNVNEGDQSSSLATQDTWLAQMRAKAEASDHGGLVLCGDDTWLKLFPGMFARADGTTSFFVSDFTEVDANVTRHVAAELARDDWSVLVLHYLGLDHIGHKGGPHSAHMVPKQREMDAVVQTIHAALAAQTGPHQNTLLVVAGDHGMNEAGNHGASSAGETSPALVFVSPQLQELAEADGPLTVPLPPRDDFRFYQTVEQADLAPTLAALLGFPPPTNSLGAVIPAFLPLWSPHDQAHILLQNAHQLQGVLAAAFGTALFATDRDCASPQADLDALGCLWQTIVRDAPPAGDLDGAWTAMVTDWLCMAQETMSGMASDYDVSKLGLGVAVATAGLGLAVVAAVLLGTAAEDRRRSTVTTVGPLAGLTAAYGAMMFASSYVEEEHHFWYWATTAWVAVAGLRQLAAVSSRAAQRRVALFSLAALAAVRLTRAWNQTGQKYAGAPDVVKTFVQPQPALLWLLVGATYGLLGVRLAQGLGGPRARRPLSPGWTAAAVSLLVAVAGAFKLVFALSDAPELVGGLAQPLAALCARSGVSLVAWARAVFVGLGVAAVVGWRQRSAKSLLAVYGLLAVTQSRPANVPLFLLADVVLVFLARLQHAGTLAAADRTTATLLLQYASFFALGGTNAISSVDLSSAYNGIAGFSAPAVGLLIFVGNWAAPIYWAFAGVVLLPHGTPAAWARHVALLTVFAAASSAAVMAACTALRTHLFVWTVFSPKLLYCATWTLGMHLGVNVLLGGLLHAVGR